MKKRIQNSLYYVDSNTKHKPEVNISKWKSVVVKLVEIMGLWDSFSLFPVNEYACVCVVVEKVHFIIIFKIF